MKRCFVSYPRTHAPFGAGPSNGVLGALLVSVAKENCQIIVIETKQRERREEG